MWQIRGSRCEKLRFHESGETAVPGRCGVRHNGDGEKNGDANQMKGGRISGCQRQDFWPLWRCGRFPRVIR